MFTYLSRFGLAAAPGTFYFPYSKRQVGWQIHYATEAQALLLSAIVWLERHQPAAFQQRVVVKLWCWSVSFNAEGHITAVISMMQ